MMRNVIPFFLLKMVAIKNFTMALSESTSFKAVLSEWGPCDKTTCIRTRIVMCSTLGGDIVNESNCDALPGRLEKCADCVAELFSDGSGYGNIQKKISSTPTTNPGSNGLKLMPGEVPESKKSQFIERTSSSSSARNKQYRKNPINPWVVGAIMYIAVGTFLCALLLVWRQIRNDSRQGKRKEFLGQNEEHPRDIFEPNINPFSRFRKKEKFQPTFPGYKDIEIGAFRL